MLDRILNDLLVVLGILSWLLPFIYAPFAKTWFRAFAVQTFVIVSYLVFRFGIFGEDYGPGIFFIIVIVENLAGVAIVRGVKLLVFRVTPLEQIEQRIRIRIRRNFFTPPSPPQ